MDSKVRLHVASIQIVTGHASPIITDDDAIRVDHGHYFEDYALSQLLGLVAISKQILDKALHHVGAIRLARVHPSTDYRILFLLVHGQAELGVVILELRQLNLVVVLGVCFHPRRDREQWHVDATERLAEHGLLEDI